MFRICITSLLVIALQIVFNHHIGFVRPSFSGCQLLSAEEESNREGNCRPYKGINVNTRNLHHQTEIIINATK